MQPNERDDVARQIELTERYLAQDPDNPSLMARLIDLLMAAGARDRAYRQLDRALMRLPDDPHFLFRRAEADAAAGAWQEAEPVFERLLAEHGDINIACALADCRAARGDHEGAIAALDRFRGNVDFGPDAAALVIRSLHHLGRLKDALAIIKEKQKAYADHPAFCATAALAAFDAEELDLAVVLSESAKRTGVAPVAAMVVDGSVALAKLDADLAIATFNDVLARNPREGRSWLGLGAASLIKRDLQTALSQLKTARDCMPHHIGTMHLLAWCQIFLGDLQAAEEGFQYALEEDRNFADSHGGLAVVHALKGERAQADGALQRALRLDPKSLAAHYAQMVLSGDAADPERFNRLALKLLAGRRMPAGGDMASLLRGGDGR